MLLNASDTVDVPAMILRRLLQVMNGIAHPDTGRRGVTTDAKPVRVRVQGLGLGRLISAVDPRRLVRCGCIAILGTGLAIGSAQAQRCRTLPPAEAGMLPTQITPVTLRIPQQRITPVLGTDGFVHLAYAAQMINVAHDPASLEAITPTDPMHGLQPTGANGVLDVNGEDITGKVLPFMPEAVDGKIPLKAVYAKQLQGGAAGIMFFDVRFATINDVPRLLSHRLSIAFPGKDQPLQEDVDPIEVDCLAPVVISPPLSGSGWWNGNGCCAVISPHRGATLPVNGDFKLPEQFAIDWVQLNDRNGCCTGPVKQLGSWPFFGVPILAAADGVVVDKVDGMAEQVPGEVKGINAQNAAGNNIIEDIGGGHYVLYAHMQTGSIPGDIAVGTRLKRGQQIGKLGNTGSSTAPHLHFQVMDRPSALNATGLPFVFDRQILEGWVTDTAGHADSTYEAGGTVTVERGTPTEQVDRMPLQGQIFNFEQH